MGRLTKEEALRLYREAPLADLCGLAQAERYRHVPERRVSYQIDRNVNYTNVCLSGCKFCNFHCRPDEPEKAYTLSFEDYRICGVVKAPSTASSFGFAHVYFPYTPEPGYNALDENMPISGSLTVYLVMKNKAQRDAVWEQLQARIREFNQANQGIMQLEFNQRPMSNSQTTLHYMYYQDEQYSKFNLWEVVRYYIYLMFLLLIVPAINLSGMISSRMEDRLPEMGVMKSFGASKSRLLGQVLWENLLLTFIGGLLGLLFLWGGLVIAKNWIFSLFYLWGIDIRPSAEIPFEVPSEVMFSPLLLIAVLLICVAVNVLSALIPAWYALRKPIVFSINQKD